MKRASVLYLLSVAVLLAAVSVSAAPATVTALSPDFRLQTSNPSVMPAQTTIRQKIVDEVERRLAKIDSQAAPLANGYQYQTDIGKNTITRWTTHTNQALIAKANG